MMIKNTKTGFTLVEVIIVVVIAGILLAMTFNLGWDYINFLQYKQDRESLLNLLDTTIVTSRTTNYYDDVKYTYLDLMFTTTSLSVMYGTGNATSTSTCTPIVGEEVFGTHTLTEGLISATGLSLPGTIRIIPFQIACYSETQVTDICSTTTGVNFTIASVRGDHTTCYYFDLSTCKFAQVVCP